MKVLWIQLALLGLVCVSTIEPCGDVPLEDFSENFAHQRSKRSTSPRKGCNPVEEQPENRFNSTERLSGLRAQMQSQGVQAFLVPSGDSHQSEYIALADKRLKFISGFSGSGFAVITMDKAALWTDGRYFMQADDQLDCDWMFMKGQEGGDQGFVQWMATQLLANNQVGADPTLTGAVTWISWKTALAQSKFELVPLLNNPIDAIWDDQPERNMDPLTIHDLRFAGQSWEEKIQVTREDLLNLGHDAMVITALDEIAWLFNMRGNDIPYNPVFRGYTVVSMTEIILYIPVEKQTPQIRSHLKSDNCGSPNCVQIRDYLLIFEELATLAKSWTSVVLGKKWAYSGGGSYAIYSLLPSDKLHFDPSPVMLRKGRKNEVEIRGMINANIRDATALISFAAEIEAGMDQGEEWNELKAAKNLLDKRFALKYNKGLSFPSISAYGANGAIVHYKPTNVTNAPIGVDSLYLLDSGGQYLDGTTDVTRTFSFGTPTDHHREMYTRVLMGSIDLARAVFPEGTPDTRLDILARWHLTQVGLNYRHGTGHGIGAYGLIHESPIQVRLYAKEEHPFEVGQFFSNEPGYYESDGFGIRLETVFRVVERPDLLHNGIDDYGTMLGFEPVCLVPFEPKMIDFDMMNAAQIDWLNKYNLQIREKIGPMLQDMGQSSGLEWMMKRTAPILKHSESLRYHDETTESGMDSSSGTVAPNLIVFIMFGIIQHWVISY